MKKEVESISSASKQPCDAIVLEYRLKCRHCRPSSRGLVFLPQAVFVSRQPVQGAKYLTSVIAATDFVMSCSSFFLY